MPLSQVRLEQVRTVHAGRRTRGWEEGELDSHQALGLWPSPRWAGLREELADVFRNSKQRSQGRTLGV